MGLKAVVELYKAHASEDGLPARQSGRLPMLVIDGIPYYIETRFNVLRPVNIYLPEIDYGACSRLTNDGQHQLFFYDKKCGKGINDLSGYIPENVLLVKVPENRFLDPFMHSMLTNLPVSRFLENGRLLMYRVAETVPVTQRMINRVINKMGPRESFENLFNNAKRIALAANSTLQTTSGTKHKKRRNSLR
ncbi:hypothetical protein HF324_27695 [Chitinophaga oryzae]|uniref:Uncharacterized protein n=1 Tax=Chitinophaga oryzae TaxID=2725414 RepID=A0AAE7DB18_9BACT|nr:hypothetical protein [Chitinophaga oryzae]QJB34909.1 hypothetical protein HF329_27835 [Chitinophaga oryzae]QJB41420.1 hypothetical protein HF324_27695 [Chitinophaga oryzae]